MGAGIADLLVFAIGCAFPLMFVIAVLGNRGLNVARGLSNRFFWSAEPLPHFDPERLSSAVLWEAANPILASTTAVMAAAFLTMAPTPIDEWCIPLGLAIGCGSAASVCAVCLAHCFDVSYQRALVLHLVFLPVLTVYLALVLLWLSLVIAVSALLMIGAGFLLGALG